MLARRQAIESTLHNQPQVVAWIAAPCAWVSSFTMTSRTVVLGRGVCGSSVSSRRCMRTRRLAARPPEALLCVSADWPVGAVLGQLQEEEEEVIREEKPSPIEVSSVTRPVHGLPPSNHPQPR